METDSSTNEGRQTILYPNLLLEYGSNDGDVCGRALLERSKQSKTFCRHQLVTLHSNSLLNVCTDSSSTI